MKKLVIATVGALVLTAGGFGLTHVEQAEAATQKLSYLQHQQVQVTTADVKSLTEYATLAAKVDVTKYSVQVVEDNKNNRVIVLNDANGRSQFKSVFVKRDSRLKIVDYKGGLIFNQILGQATALKATPKTQQATKVSTSSKYSAKVVTDNQNKRITLYKDANGHVKYKTILIKRTGMLKKINL